jgi:hypothetical protein
MVLSNKNGKWDRGNKINDDIWKKEKKLRKQISTKLVKEQKQEQRSETTGPGFVQTKLPKEQRSETTGPGFVQTKLPKEQIYIIPKPEYPELNTYEINNDNQYDLINDYIDIYNELEKNIMHKINIDYTKNLKSALIIKITNVTNIPILIKLFRIMESRTKSKDLMLLLTDYINILYNSNDYVFSYTHFIDLKHKITTYYIYLSWYTQDNLLNAYDAFTDDLLYNIHNRDIMIKKELVLYSYRDDDIKNVYYDNIPLYFIIKNKKYILLEYIDNRLKFIGYKCKSDIVSQGTNKSKFQKNDYLGYKWNIKNIIIKLIEEKEEEKKVTEEKEEKKVTEEKEEKKVTEYSLFGSHSGNFDLVKLFEKSHTVNHNLNELIFNEMIYRALIELNIEENHKYVSMVYDNRINDYNIINFYNSKIKLTYDTIEYYKKLLNTNYINYNREITLHKLPPPGLTKLF